MPHLPQPDPFEPAGSEPPTELAIAAPTVVYLGGSPTEADERIAGAILAARPGALVVVPGG